MILLPGFPACLPLNSCIAEVVSSFSYWAAPAYMDLLIPDNCFKVKYISKSFYPTKFQVNQHFSFQ